MPPSWKPHRNAPLFPPAPYLHRTAARTLATEDLEPLYKEDTWYADFTSNNTIYEKFPFSLWRKTMREVLSEYELELVQRAHFLGVPPLRKAIADYLYRSRGMSVSPECCLSEFCTEIHPEYEHVLVVTCSHHLASA